MKQYIGTKMIQAEPATRGECYKGPNMLSAEAAAQDGYRVRYSDSYESWSPKEAFEKAYLPLETNPDLKTNAPSISQRMVDDFIDDVKVITLDGKTTVVRVLLKNGFTCVEASSCVSPENYDEAMGAKICMERIKNQIWKLLGFLLQTAVGGVK